LTTFIVKCVSRLFLTNLQSRCRAAELWCCGEVSSSARGDDDRHARPEEQRASGLAKVVKSNLGKPGLSKRAVQLTDEIALAEIGSGVGAEYPFQPEEPSRPPLRLPSCYALMENALGCAVRFRTPIWQFLALKRTPGTRTGLFASNSRIVGNPYLIKLRQSCPTRNATMGLYGSVVGAPKLCLLCEVVVVLAFIKPCANKRHTFGF
jgi:hypothetical protein